MKLESHEEVPFCGMYDFTSTRQHGSHHKQSPCPPVIHHPPNTTQKSFLCRALPNSRNLLRRLCKPIHYQNCVCVCMPDGGTMGTWVDGVFGPRVTDRRYRGKANSVDTHPHTHTLTHTRTYTETKRGEKTGGCGRGVS